MKRVAFIGAGSHLHSVYDSMDKDKYEVVGCLDNLLETPTTNEGIAVLGKLDDFDVLKNHEVEAVMICIGDLKMRERLLKKVNECGLEMFSVIDDSAIVSLSAVIKEGTFVGKRAIVNANTTIGQGSIINSGSIIEHDVVIDTNVHVAPGAVVCGGVNIGDSTLIGANATVIQQITIGTNAVIGAGATIIRDVKDGTTVVGTPGKEIK
ncbi:MAG: acetyltransferase [Erysipelotrichales bacterium]|nr:acetyltransferase [Erysipelotrichales bacterium]